MYIHKLKEEDNVFGDHIAFVQLWDFSKANINDESRIEAITTVASICYDNPEVVGKESLYNRLAAEAKGLPSSSFEFVPVLLDRERLEMIILGAIQYNREESNIGDFILDVEKYGQFITIQENDVPVQYLLTNYRALYHDNEKYGARVNFLEFYNTSEADQKIIFDHWTTFLMKMDINTSKQHNRHRIVLQELSRRYVSGKKNAFEFYVSEKMKFVSDHKDDESDIFLDETQINNFMVERYFQAIERGNKPQDARRILPQSMYTTIWSSFLPFQLKNYLALRDDNHAQHEIKWISQSIKRLLKMRKDEKTNRELNDPLINKA